MKRTLALAALCLSLASAALTQTVTPAPSLPPFYGTIATPNHQGEAEMTLTLEVPPQIAHRVQQVRSAGVDIDTLFAQWVETLPAQEIEEDKRLAAIEAGYGKFAGHGSSEDVMADRRADLELERRRLGV